MRFKIFKTKNSSIQINFHRIFFKSSNIFDQSRNLRHTGQFSKRYKTRKSTRIYSLVFSPKSWRKIFTNRDSSRGRYFPSGCSSPWVTVCFETGIDSQAPYISSSSEGCSICWNDRDEGGIVVWNFISHVSRI